MIAIVPHCGYLSETSRMLEIHRALIERGAPVRLMSHGGTHQGLLGEAGVDYDLLEPVRTPQRCAEMVQRGPGMGPVDQSMWSDDELLTSAEAQAAYFRDHGVTVLVTGFELPTLLSSRLAGVALVTEHAGCWVPIVAERGLIPLPGPRNLPEELLAMPSKVARRLYNERFGRSDYYTAGFNRVAARLGVEPVPSLAALFLGDLTLIPEVPELLGVSVEDMAGWRPRPGSGYRSTTRLEYVGPIFAHLNIPLPARVAALLDLRGPTVYVALTSMTPDVVRAVVRNVVGGGGWNVIVAGTVHNVADLEDLAPGRVVVGGVLPSHKILPRVAAAVLAGGQGSVQSALASGTPFVGIALHPEQALNLDLAARAGAAIPRSVDQLVGVGLDVAALLTTDAYRLAAARVRRLYASVDGPGLAADRILAVHNAPRTHQEVAR